MEDHNTTNIGSMSDGYHTFDELYEFRKVYNAALFNEWANTGKYHVHKSLCHHDGELCFGGGWFIVVAMLPTGQISNHYQVSDWDLFQIPAEDQALFEFDGHTANDVAIRLRNFLSGNFHDAVFQTKDSAAVSGLSHHRLTVVLEEAVKSLHKWRELKDQVSRTLNAAQTFYSEVKTLGLSLNAVESEGYLRGLLGVSRLMDQISEDTDLSNLEDLAIPAAGNAASLLAAATEIENWRQRALMAEAKLATVQHQHQKPNTADDVDHSIAGLAHDVRYLRSNIESEKQAAIDRYNEFSNTDGIGCSMIEQSGYVRGLAWALAEVIDIFSLDNQK